MFLFFFQIFFLTFETKAGDGMLRRRPKCLYAEDNPEQTGHFAVTENSLNCVHNNQNA